MSVLFCACFIFDHAFRKIDLCDETDRYGTINLSGEIDLRGEIVLFCEIGDNFRLTFLLNVTKKLLCQRETFYLQALASFTLFDKISR
ncbi:hypothetical protein BBC0244_016610 [Bartonella apihabitans]|nr:hypothetical protein BBC0244_016610 [Bartonella apihabitans]